ncbi:MAG: NnrS family protein, partial [Nevskiaceae bacterium]
RMTVVIYALVNAAAIARIVAAFAIGPVSLLLAISAGFWILSFLLFCLRYGPMLLGAAPR